LARYLDAFEAFLHRLHRAVWDAARDLDVNIGDLAREWHDLHGKIDEAARSLPAEVRPVLHGLDRFAATILKLLHEGHIDEAAAKVGDHDLDAVLNGLTGRRDPGAQRRRRLR
jgi:hypothetical protein